MLKKLVLGAFVFMQVGTLAQQALADIHWPTCYPCPPSGEGEGGEEGGDE